MAETDVGQPRKRRRPRREELQEPWLEPPVPNGYWHDVRNRRRYLRWLGERLRFTKREDWYGISTGAIIANYGGGVLVQWNHSAVAAVRELFPNHEWHEWLFGSTSRRFWKDRGNHRPYLDWLGKQLKIRRFEDWYHVANRDFAQHAGSSLLLEYQSTVSRAIMTCFPEHEWKEWLFDHCPVGFWRSVANRSRYLRWLGKRQGFKRPTDWYALTIYMLHTNHGRGLARFHRSSIPAIVREHFPNRLWHEWLFPRVSVGFWKKPENRRAYLDWLGAQLGIQRPEEWVQVRTADLKRNRGGALLAEFASLVNLFQEYLPHVERPRRHLAGADPVLGRRPAREDSVLATRWERVAPVASLANVAVRPNGTLRNRVAHKA